MTYKFTQIIVNFISKTLAKIKNMRTFAAG